jgi:hypothetical protein
MERCRKDLFSYTFPAAAAGIKRKGKMLNRVTRRALNHLAAREKRKVLLPV